jgi:two-component system, chemotaxis family, CheB/CheR fusion protein
MAVRSTFEPHIASAETDLPAHELALSSQQVFGSKSPRSRAKVSRQPTKGKGQEKARLGAVLIVDDVPDVTEMIGLLLKHAGYDVSTADSAESALRLARKTNYDLVISDIGMPEMNGYELAEALRALNNYAHTPMIAVTGYSEYDDRGRAVEAGFNVHLTKPIEPAQLLNLMSELLSRAPSGINH